jgi:hypothetical protein
VAFFTLTVKIAESVKMSMALGLAARSVTVVGVSALERSLPATVALSSATSPHDAPQRVNDMTTKKVGHNSSQRLERGRFAKLLAAGYSIEVTPSPERKAIETKTPASSATARPSKT